LSKAVSPMKASTEPMVTGFPAGLVQGAGPLAKAVLGQMRPQISGHGRGRRGDLPGLAHFVLCRQAERQSGMLFCSGQAFWQKGTPQSVQRPAWTSTLSVDGLTMISPKSCTRTDASALGRRRG